jgi:hypothetical protein
MTWFCNYLCASNGRTDCLWVAIDKSQKYTLCYGNLKGNHNLFCHFSCDIDTLQIGFSPHLLRGVFVFCAITLWNGFPISWYFIAVPAFKTGFAQKLHYHG